MQHRNREWPILALFFCSGATALVYEVLWSKFLSQMFGSTVYAQTVVLAAFMGGLALGNRLFGRWADGLKRPVQWYGYLEILIGVYALLFPMLDRAADGLFIAVGTPIAERAGLLLVLKGVLSVALLILPTVLMGGTLPLMAAWLQRSSMDAGRRSARFYAVNSLGAVTGAALAGFWLVQSFGMISTLWGTAFANIVLGTAAIMLDRLLFANAGSTPGVSHLPAGTSPAGTKNEPADRLSAEPRLLPQTLRRAGLIVAVTGAVSMGLEVLSARSLALIFGSSLQTFAVVLMAFILGIGLGSAWIASPRRSRGSGERLAVLLPALAAAWVTLSVFNIERWVDVYRIAQTGLGRTEVGYIYHQLFATSMALVILGFPAALIGAVLPLMIRGVSAEGAPLGAKVGALLTWNTLGAVVGTLVTGFVLMPLAGLRNSFAILALVLALAALGIAWQRKWRIGMAVTGATVGLAACLFAFGSEGWRHVMSTGIFRLRETEFEPRFMETLKQHVKIVFYEDAPDATVTVEEVDGIIGPRNLGLRINGKPDAGTSHNLPTQLFGAHLPMLSKPGAKDVFVLGLGSGMTAGAVLAYPVNKVVVAENCEPVIRAARLFDGWNRGILDDPRADIWAEDARTVLKLRPDRYDVIITVPSNPWTAGVGSVFSKEYYELAASRLKPGGIVAQWFHVYEMEDRLVALVLRTFSSVFPHIEVWDNGADIVMLGSLDPWESGLEVFRKGFEIDRVRSDLWMIDIQSPETLLARQLASQRTGFAIAGEGRIQSDMHPFLEYAAPRAFYLAQGSRMLDRYDERTHQQLLAPVEKRQALAAIPLPQAQVLFQEFSSVNGELYGCLFGLRFSARVPCLLPTPAPAPPPAASGSVRDAAVRAFAEGNVRQAHEWIQIALQQTPDDPETRYLSRVIAREKSLSEKAVEQAFNDPAR